MKFGPNCRQIMLINKVQEFTSEHKYMFKLDEVYGLDIEAALFKFAKECIREYNAKQPTND